MCLPYEEIKGYLHYYALRLRNNRFERWELVNEAWIKIYPLEIPAFASAGIRWAMITYKKLQYAQDHKGSSTIMVSSIDDEIADGLFSKNILITPKDRQKKNLEDTDYVNYLLRSPALSLSDKLLIDQRFFQGLTLRQIGRIYSVTYEAVRLRLEKILDKLKRISEAA